MTDRRRNFSIIGLVVVLLALAGYVMATKETKLGLDLRGGVELVYEARPTPKVPQITPQAVEDAISTIRKRTDALGVAEPEISRSGAQQISVALPDVENAQNAIDQVGTTAQLQFYDWEPNLILGQDEEGQTLERPEPSLYEAVQLAKDGKPRAEASDVPPGGVEPAVERRFGNDTAKIRGFYDRRNDTGTEKFYLFAPGEGPTRKLIDGPAPSCAELLQPFTDRAEGGNGGGTRAPPKNSECRAELEKLGRAGPPEGATVIRVPRGIVVVRGERPQNAPASVPINQHWVLEDDSELSGSDVKNPKQGFDPQTNAPIVTMEFTDQGRQAFARVTKRIAERGAQEIPAPGEPPDATFQRFAITLDNQIVSLATINFRENPEGIDGRTGAQITGIGNIDETQQLADNLRIGALPVDLQLISNTQVSATLGQQALDQGLLAGIAGLLLTLIFLIAFYRILGVIAGVALVIYAIFLYALIELVPITMTLPGIAGTILTLAVAADANIVIFERIKEEARTGAAMTRAISQGYAKALRTIIDANVVTIGVAFILFMVATAGVKGFAFTLLVGTLVSLFTAVLATSAILGAMARTRLLRSRFALGIGDPDKVRWRFDFTGASRWFFSASGMILLIGALAIAGLGLKFGIDFEGGTRIQTPIERSASVDQVRAALPAQIRGQAEIQEVEDEALGENVFQISTSDLAPGEEQRVRETLDETFGVPQGAFTTSSIGPTFGAQVANTAVIAIIASLLLIAIYIGVRFEAKFAIPVLIAIAHDLLITAGVYALTEREVTTSTVAALLTIIGYSLYDTIIVFDRIRENVPRMPRATFSQIVNRSMSEVLTRSLVTSVSTLFPIGALMLFGGETLRDFGFALLVGVASGAYSSIFIAAPLVVAWKEREQIYRRRRQIIMEDHGGVVPAFATGAVSHSTGGVPTSARAARPAASTGAVATQERPAGATAPPRGPAEATIPPGAPAATGRPPAPARGGGAGNGRSDGEGATNGDGDGEGATNGGGDGAGSGDGGGAPAAAGAAHADAGTSGSAAERRAAARNRRKKRHGRRWGRYAFLYWR